MDYHDVTAAHRFPKSMISARTGYRHWKAGEPFRRIDARKRHHLHVGDRGVIAVASGPNCGRAETTELTTKLCRNAHDAAAVALVKVADGKDTQGQAGSNRIVTSSLLGKSAA